MEAVQFRIARPTNQLSDILRFYQEGLGLPLIGSFENHAGYDGVMFGLPSAGHHLEFTQFEQGSPCPAPTKDNLLVLYYDDPAKYLAAIDRLIRFGVKPVEPENPYWLGKSETFEDPDGWRIVLHNGTYQSH